MIKASHENPFPSDAQPMLKIRGLVAEVATREAEQADLQLPIVALPTFTARQNPCTLIDATKIRS